jgi:hypothetical protein
MILLLWNLLTLYNGYKDVAVALCPACVDSTPSLPGLGLRHGRIDHGTYYTHAIHGTGAF